jgi:hypothetical protein
MARKPALVEIPGKVVEIIVTERIDCPYLNISDPNKSIDNDNACCGVQ